MDEILRKADFVTKLLNFKTKTKTKTFKQQIQVT